MRRIVLPPVVACLLTGLKDARGAQYPPSQHEHKWTAGAPIPKPIVILTYPSTTYQIRYLRCYEIACLFDIASATDWDQCTAPGCPFPNGWAADGKVRVRWSDNGAGGLFGTLDSNGNFIPLDPVADAQQITHYMGLQPGIVHITLEVEDMGLYYNDDGPVSNDADNGNVTVWEFWITPCPENWRPKLDSSLNFTAYIRPTTDHRGQSMARTIKFFLESSFEPGYCLNATREVGAWNDTRGYDLKFPDQPGFTIGGLDRNIATTVSATTDVKVQVVCLDYGAYGAISAIADGLGQARLKGTLDKWEAQIPVDENPRNFIADVWGGNRLGEAMLDNENVPAGRTPGDGFSLYEEYRGFVVKGVWTELDPFRKDVFIVNLLDEYHPGIGLGLGYFPNLGTINHVIWHTEYRSTPYRPQHINFNFMTAHVENQSCIVLTDGGYSLEDLGGETTVSLPFSPECIIYTQNIREVGRPNILDRFTWDLEDVEFTRIIIAHELGHAVHMRHHLSDEPNFTQEQYNCVMFSWRTIEEAVIWLMTLPRDYCAICRSEWYLRLP